MTRKAIIILALLIIVEFQSNIIHVQAAENLYSFKDVHLSELLSGVEIEPYFQFGGIGLYEDGNSEGHKSFVGLGVNIGKSFNDHWQGFISLSAWKLSEALDEDQEIPVQGFRIGGECHYNFSTGDFKFSPFALFGYNKMKRENSTSINEWTYKFSFADVQAGMLMQYKWFFLKAVAKVPVLLECNGRHLDSNLGGFIGGGVEIYGFSIGYFYETTSFDNNEKGRTAINSSYIKISYRF